jgi:predicted small secreted protein
MGISSMSDVSSERARRLPMRMLAGTGIMRTAVMATGCNTIKGVGQDLRKAGEKLEDAARKN